MRLVAAVSLMMAVVAACAPASPSAPVRSPAPTAAPVGSPSPTTISSAEPTPLPDLEVLCRADGNRPDASCDELLRVALAAVSGLPRPAAAVGLSAYGFPCDVPIPQAPPTGPCEVDVDAGPVAWVAFDGTPTIAALRFTAADFVINASLVAFGQTPMSIGMLLDAADPASVASPVPTQPADVGTPQLELASGTRIEPVMRGGCGSVAYLGEFVAGDQCGPTVFYPAIEAPAVRVASGARLVLTVTDGWRLGTDDALAEPWIVRIASTSRLSGKGEQDFSPAGDIGRTLKDGTAAQRRIAVTLPTTPGDYLLQLSSGLTRDGWSFTEGTFYWHLRVR